MLQPQRLDGLLACVTCGESRWRAQQGAVACEACGATVSVDGGVVRINGDSPDPVAAYYEDIGGPHFVGTSFVSNLHVYFASRAYERAFDEFFPAGGIGSLVDLGCGDGRLSLLALERGCRTVVAVDRTLAPLKRLAAEAQRRGLSGLVPVQASFDSACLRAEAFDVALGIEAFTYLGDRYQDGLHALLRTLRPDGLGMLSEFCRHGRALVDVVAINLENMAKVSAEGARYEKAGPHKLVQRLFGVEELVRECERAGFRVERRRGISPIPMLFHYAYSLTSYPLRPPADAALESLLGSLDEQSTEVSDLSRNAILLLRKPR